MHRPVGHPIVDVTHNQSVDHPINLSINESIYVDAASADRSMSMPDFTTHLLRTLTNDSTVTDNVVRLTVSLPDELFSH